MIFQEYKNPRYWIWNGFNIAWNVVHEEGKIAILLLHGFGASSAHWRNNIYFFAKNGYSVYTIDLLGFGKSDQPGIREVGRLDNGIWCDQVIDFISEVIRPINSKEIFIIGNSLGGLTALTCAAVIPNEIAGIIASPLPDPISLKINKTNLNSRYGYLKLKLLKIIFYLIPLEIILFLINKLGIIDLGLKSAYKKKEKIDKDLLDMVRIPSSRRNAAKALRAMCFGMSTRSEKLKSSFLLDTINKIKKVEFLMIWGERDNFIPLFFGKRIAKFYPWVKLEVISDSGHCVHDEDHDKFNQISLEWIKNLNTFKK